MESAHNPKVLIVYFTLTKQVGRVVDVMTRTLEARGCDTSTALIEFTDERWVPQLSQFPMKRPFPQIASILLAQARHKTGEIKVPAEAKSGDYDLIVLASPTWWFQTSMPMRSYLLTPGANTILGGKPFACVSVSRRYFNVNLRQQKNLAEKSGGRWLDKTHFVVAGGQVKSMLAWLGFMKYGKPQPRMLGLKLPPPNLQPSFEAQASEFIDGLVDQAFGKAP